MKTLIKTLALAATLLGFASCGSNPDPGPASMPPPTYIPSGK